MMNFTRPFSLFASICTVLLVFTAIAINQARAEVVDIGENQLSDLLAKNVRIVDLRRADEWQDTGVIEGSILETFFDEKGNHRAKQWFESVSGQTSESEQLILICHTGVRSKVVANWLDKFSPYEKIYNVKDGIAKWIGMGRKVVKPEE